MDTPKMTRSVLIGYEEVMLDSDNLRFNEATLSKFQENIALFYDYYGAKLSDAEAIRDGYEMQYEVAYAKKYTEFKGAGCTEKQAESSARSDLEVIAAREKYLGFKKKAKDIQQHLRAWDKAHESAQNRSHTLRKEMDKLNTNIYSEDVVKSVEDIIKGE